MSAFLIKRACSRLFALWGVVTLVFLILQLSGDPTLLMVPEGATQQEIAELRHQLGFDRPLVVQYLDYIWQLARFDLGVSFVQNLRVSEIVYARVPYTFYLAFMSLLVCPWHGAAGWASSPECSGAAWPNACSCPWFWWARACPPFGPAFCS
jgi:peptide/nickel transport system permease protein